MKLYTSGARMLGIAALLIVTSAFAAWGKSSVEGTVVDFYGRSLDGAVLELRGESLPKTGLHATSDANGYFQVRDLEAGDYELTVLFRGFRREVVPVHLTFGEVKRLIVGLEVLKITDVEPINISGVVQSGGKPLSDVLVTVTNMFNQRSMTTAKTDKHGRYQLKVYDGGQYLISAFRPGFEASVETRRFDSFPINKPRNYSVNLTLLRFRDL